MAIEQGSFTMSIMDAAAKVGTMNVHIIEPTDANFGDLITTQDNFIGTIESLIYGTVQRSSLQFDKDYLNGVPANDDAKRHNKFVVYLRSLTTNEKWHFTIPTAKDFDGTNLKRAGTSNEVDLTTAWWTQAAQNGSLGVSRIDAIQAFSKSQVTRSAGVITGIWLQDN